MWFVCRRLVDGSEHVGSRPRVSKVCQAVVHTTAKQQHKGFTTGAGGDGPHAVTVRATVNNTFWFEGLIFTVCRATSHHQTVLMARRLPVTCEQLRVQAPHLHRHCTSSRCGPSCCAYCVSRRCWRLHAAQPCQHLRHWRPVQGVPQWTSPRSPESRKMKLLSSQTQQPAGHNALQTRALPL